MVANLFLELLYCEKMKVDGRPRSFGPARFSLTMTLNLYPTFDFYNLILSTSLNPLGMFNRLEILKALKKIKALRNS